MRYPRHRTHRQKGDSFVSESRVSRLRVTIMLQPTCFHTTPNKLLRPALQALYERYRGHQKGRGGTTEISTSGNVQHGLIDPDFTIS